MTMKLSYKDKEYDIRYSFRAIMCYENITNKSFQLNTMTDMIQFFFACILSEDLKIGNEPVVWDEFVDWIDENPDTLYQFVLWYNRTQQTNNDLSPKVEENKKSEGEPDPKN